MTVIAIINDGWHTIIKNKSEFVDRIEDGMHGIDRICGTPHLSKKRITRHRIQNHSSAIIANRSFHADDETLLYVGMNNMKNLTHADLDLDMEQMIMRMKDIKRAKDMLKRSTDNMYSRIAEHILITAKQKGKNEEEITNYIIKLMDKVVKEADGVISDKTLQKEMKRLR